MTKNSILRKYSAILALAVSAIVFLPEALFAQGAVVAYADYNKWGDPNNLNDFPSNEQLDELTHVMVVD